MADNNTSLPATFGQNGGSPFDQIRRLDTYGREYWSARELMPLLGYSNWQNFNEAVAQARGIIAAEQGEPAAAAEITDSSKITKNARGQKRNVPDYELSRHASYLTAMRGDSRKPEIRAALTYFAVRTRQAELHAFTAADIQRTALARAREMVDYRIFRDMMRDNAADYEPSSRETRIFFGATQNALYRQITGMTADQIKNARELQTWTGRADGKPEPGPKSKDRQVAKNYLAEAELRKLERLVGLLCLRAEILAEDGKRLTLTQWRELVDAELQLTSRRALAA